MWQTEINNYGSFLVLLTPPLPLKTQKIRILKKWKKLLKYYFTLVYQKPSETGKYVVLLSNFLPFDSPNNSENRRCHHFTRVPKITIIWCMLPEIWSVTVTFCPFTPLLTPLKIKIWKKCKNTWRYYLLSYVYHKSRSYEVWFLRYKAQRT